MIKFIEKYLLRIVMTVIISIVTALLVYLIIKSGMANFSDSVIQIFQSTVQQSLVHS